MSKIPTTNLQVTKVAEMSQFSRKQVRPNVLKICILLGLQYFAPGEKCQYRCLSSQTKAEETLEDFSEFS